MSGPIRIRRGDSHRDQLDYQHHRCPPRNRPKSYITGEYSLSSMDSDDDLCELAIGVYGEGMPKEVPFPVTAVCPACHGELVAWYVWT